MLKVFRVELTSPGGLPLSLPVKDFQTKKEVEEFTRCFQWIMWSFEEVRLANGGLIKVTAIPAAKVFEDEISDECGYSLHTVVKNEKEEIILDQRRGDWTNTLPCAYFKEHHDYLVALDRIHP